MPVTTKTLHAAPLVVMPARKAPTRKDLEREEKDIGKNIPEGMRGLDTEDA